MIDVYLRADSAIALEAATVAAGVCEIFDGSLVPADGFAIDVIGRLSRITGLDEDGQPVAEVLPGYHANMRGPFTEEHLSQLAGVVIPEPANPVRVWA